MTDWILLIHDGNIFAAAADDDDDDDDDDDGDDDDDDDDVTEVKHGEWIFNSNFQFFKVTLSNQFVMTCFVPKAFCLAFNVY